MAVHAFDQLAAEVTILANLLRKNSASVHRAEAISPGALEVLRLLSAHGDLTVPALGRLRVTSRQNIQIVVNRLRAAGLIESASNPSHKRSLLVRLTPGGAALLTSAAQRDENQHQDMASKIPEQEAINAVETLRRVRKMLAQDRPVARTRKPRALPEIKPPVPDQTVQEPDEFPVNLL